MNYLQVVGRQTDKQTIDVFCFLSEMEIEMQRLQTRTCLETLISVGASVFSSLIQQCNTWSQQCLVLILIQDVTTLILILALIVLISHKMYVSWLHTFKSSFYYYMPVWTVISFIHNVLRLRLCEYKRFAKKLVPNSRIYIKLFLSSISNVWRYISERKSARVDRTPGSFST